MYRDKENRLPSSDTSPILPFLDAPLATETPRRHCSPLGLARPWHPTSSHRYQKPNLSTNDRPFRMVFGPA